MNPSLPPVRGFVQSPIWFQRVLSGSGEEPDGRLRTFVRQQRTPSSRSARKPENFQCPTVFIQCLCLWGSRRLHAARPTLPGPHFAGTISLAGNEKQHPAPPHLRQAPRTRASHRHLPSAISFSDHLPPPSLAFSGAVFGCALFKASSKNGLANLSLFPVFKGWPRCPKKVV